MRTAIAVRVVRSASGNERGRPGGRPTGERLMVESQLLLAGELHPEARRAKNRSNGLCHVILLVSACGGPGGAIGSGLYASRRPGVKPTARSGARSTYRCLRRRPAGVGLARSRSARRGGGTYRRRRISSLAAAIRGGNRTNTA